MRDFIKKIVSESDGSPSSMRVVFLWFSLIFTTCVCAVWTVVSLANGEVSEIPTGVTAILGTILAGKAVQKGVEVWGAKREDSEKSS